MGEGVVGQARLSWVVFLSGTQTASASFFGNGEAIGTEKQVLKWVHCG